MHHRHKYTVETSFAYYDGCDGQGKDCASSVILSWQHYTDRPPGNSSNCYYAFHTPTDYWAQEQCEVDNVSTFMLRLVFHAETKAQ